MLLVYLIFEKFCQTNTSVNWTTDKTNIITIEQSHDLDMAELPLNYCLLTVEEGSIFLVV